MNKKIILGLLIISLMLVSVPEVEAGWFEDLTNWFKDLFGMNQEEAEEMASAFLNESYGRVYTPTSSREILSSSNGVEIRRIILSGVMNVQEDGGWKKYYDAKDLKGKGFDCIIEKDNKAVDDDAECLRFNMTKEGLVKAKVKIVSKDGKKSSVKIYSYNKTEKKYKEKRKIKDINFNSIGEKSIIDVEFYADEELHIGDNSTIITIAGNETTIRDAYIDDASADTNFGGRDNMNIGFDGGVTNRRSLIGLRDPKEAANTNLLNGTFFMIIDNTQNDEGRAMGVYEVGKVWKEGSAAAGVEVGNVSWNSAQHTVIAWDNPGVDFNTTSASVNITSLVFQSAGRVQFDMKPSFVQEMVDNDATFIMLLDVETGENNKHQVFSSEHATPSNHPGFILEFAALIPTDPTDVITNSTDTAQTNLTDENLAFNFGCTHTGSLSMSWFVLALKDGVEQFTLDGGCSDGDYTEVILNSDNTTTNDLWSFGVILEDSNGANNTGGYIFSNNLTVLNSIPIYSTNPGINASAETNLTNEDLFVFGIATDSDSGASLTADVRWLKDNVSQFIFKGLSVTKDVEFLFTLKSGNTTAGELWNAEVNISDGFDDVIRNSTQLTILSSLTTPTVLFNSTSIEQLNQTNSSYSCNFLCNDDVGARTITFDLDFNENGTIPIYSIVGQSCTNPSFNAIELTPENISVGSSFDCNVNLTNSVGETTPTVLSNNITILPRNPSIPTIINPLNNTDIGNSSVIFNCSNSVDPEGNNIFFEMFGDSSNPPTTLLQNTTTETFNYTTQGSSFLRCRAVTEIGGESDFTQPIFIRMNSTKIFNITVPNLLVYETETESRNITITVNKFNTNDVSATINYNDVLFSNPTRRILLNNSELLSIEFSQSIVTAINDTITGLWNFTLDLTDATTTTNEEIFTDDILPIDFAFCNTTVRTAFINYTFKDEITLDDLNATIVSSFDFSLTSGSTQKTLLFTNSTGNEHYDLCAEPLNRTFIVDTDLRYASTGYPERSSEETLSLTSTTTLKELLLLATGDGATIVFQVINLAGQPISNVDAVVEKLIVGQFQTIEQKVTDDAGTVSFFLNPNDDYRFTFSKSGFVTQVLNIEPSSATFTVTMASSEVINITSIIKGIKSDVGPNVNTLENDTDITFTFNISSSFFSLEEAGFTMRNSTQDILGSDSCNAATGCISSATINTNSHTTMTMVYFWTVDVDGDLITGNLTKSWRILTSGTRTSSFDNFISDVEKLGSGFNEFTKAIISLLIILFAVGSLSFKFGIFSPIAILTEIFVLTAMLDRVGFIPKVPNSPVDNFITVVVGLMLMVSVIYEFSRGGP